MLYVITLIHYSLLATKAGWIELDKLKAGVIGWIREIVPIDPFDNGVVRVQNLVYGPSLLAPSIEAIFPSIFPGEFIQPSSESAHTIGMLNRNFVEIVSGGTWSEGTSEWLHYDWDVPELAYSDVKIAEESFWVLCMATLWYI